MSELHENIDPIEYAKRVPAEYEDLEQLEEIFNLRECCEMELQQIAYENCNDEEKALFDYVNAIKGFSRCEYDEFFEKVNKTKERYILDNEVVGRNKSEKTKYLNDEFSKIVQVITISDIGRDYLKYQNTEKLISLFDVSKDDKFISDSHVINLSVPKEKYGEKRRKLIERLVIYLALKELISNETSKVGAKRKEKEDPHIGKRLQDILKNPELYNPLIDYLSLKGIIHEQSHKYIDGVTNKTIMPGLLKILYDNVLLKEKLTIKLAQSVLQNTFFFDLKLDTFRRRGEIEKHHEDAINALISPYRFNNK